MRRAVGPLLAVTVALVLADSAVVTLALPDILRHLDATVGQVAWVLIAFNLVLGLAVVPTARLLGRFEPRLLTAAGIAAFAGTSAWCAAADSIDVLIVARCLQAHSGERSRWSAASSFSARSTPSAAAWACGSRSASSARPPARSRAGC
jgi:MFS family permease